MSFSRGRGYFIMHLITTFPRYSNGELNDAFMKEIMHGFEMEKAMEEKRERLAAMQAKGLRGIRSKGLGKCIQVINQKDYFRMRHKYGDEMNDPKFIQYFQKKFPEMSPNKL